MAPRVRDAVACIRFRPCYAPTAIKDFCINLCASVEDLFIRELLRDLLLPGHIEQARVIGDRRSCAVKRGVTHSPCRIRTVKRLPGGTTKLSQSYLLNASVRLGPHRRDFGSVSSQRKPGDIVCQRVGDTGTRGATVQLVPRNAAKPSQMTIRES